MKTWSGVWLVMLLFLVGCAKKPEPIRPATPLPVTPTSTVPMSQMPEPTLTRQVKIQVEISRVPTEHPPKASPTLDCTNGLTFVSDLTVPDGTRIARGAVVDKRWQIKNNGTCNWDEGYSLVLIGGPDLGAPVKQNLIPARAGAEAMIRMLLTAPDTPGSYTSAWQAHNPAGEPFGEVIYIQFQVN